MSLSSIVRELNAVYRRLFDHSPVLQSEAAFLYNEFEAHPRANDFDGLLQTSHAVNEALDSEIEERLATAPLKEVGERLQAITAALNQTLDKGKEGESEYVAARKAENAAEWERFSEEIQLRRDEVEEQFRHKMEEMNMQFAQLDPHNNLPPN